MSFYLIELAKCLHWLLDLLKVDILFFQLNGRRVPLELKLLHSVQNVEGVIKLLDFFERPDSSQAPAIKQAQEGASRLDAIYA